MLQLITTALCSFALGSAFGFTVSGLYAANRLRKEEKVKQKICISLSAEDILEIIRKARPELNVPAEAQVFGDDDGSDYDDDSPVTIEWTKEDV